MSTTSGLFRFPHPQVLLSGCVFLAALLSYVLPAGEFDRQTDNHRSCCSHRRNQPLEGLPLLASSLGMMVAQTAIHFPVPSVSGQAVLTMPVLVPLPDLLGLSRQVTVLAYQYGAGLCDLITPTNGALMAILGVAGVRSGSSLPFLSTWASLLYVQYPSQ